MTPTTLALVLTAAVLHAVWNLAAKRVSGDGFVFVWLYNLSSALLWLPIGLVVLARSGQPFTATLLLAALASAVIHIVYELSLQTGYDRADLGVVYPTARGTGPVLTIIMALALLGERPSIPSLLGALVIIGGIVVVASGSRGSGGSPLRTGLAWGVATGTAIAGYTLWDSHAVSAWHVPPTTYFALSVGFQSLLMLPGLARPGTASPLAVLRRTWREVATIAVLSPLAYILVLVALQTAPVSLVAPIRESSIVIGSLLAWWLFGEARPGRRILGAVIVLAGVALVAAGGSAM